MLFSRVSPSETAEEGCHGDDEQQTDPEDSPCDTEGETPLSENEQHLEQSQTDTQVCVRIRHLHIVHKHPVSVLACIEPNTKDTHSHTHTHTVHRL